MSKLIRDKRTGDYYTEDRKFMIEKVTIGGIVSWNVYDLDNRFNTYRYSFTTETLKNAKESI